MDLEPPQFLLCRIMYKKEMFVKKMTKIFKKSIAIDVALNIGTIALGGLLGGLASGFRIVATGIRAGAIAGVWGASLTGFVFTSALHMREDGLN